MTIGTRAARKGKCFIPTHTLVYKFLLIFVLMLLGMRCSSVIRAFAHGAMGRQIDPSW